MTKFIGTMLAAALVAGATSPLRADDKDATAIVDKAIKAIGGEEKLSKIHAATWSAKGTVSVMDMDSEVTTQTSVQGPDHFRQDFEGDFGGNKVKGITVLAGDKGWRKFADMKLELDKDTLAGQKQAAYLALVPVTVVPLKGKGFKVEMAGEDKVGDKPAVKLKGIGPDGKEFHVWFDKESGLPVKLSAKVQGFMGEDVMQEVTFGDYKEMGGIQKATKAHATRDGKKFMELQVTDFKVVDKLDPKTFAEPE